MVVTPFHVGFVWPLYAKFKGKLDFSVLTIASMVPDLEIPVLMLLTNGETGRLVLHSIAGGILMGIPLTLLIAFGLFGKINWAWFRRFNLNFEFLKPQNRLISKPVIVSAFIGIMSHVIVDVFMMHGLNASPLFWPFSGKTIAILLFNNAFLSPALMHLLAIALILRSVKKLQK